MSMQKHTRTVEITDQVIQCDICGKKPINYDKEVFFDIRQCNTNNNLGEIENRAPFPVAHVCLDCWFKILKPMLVKL